MFLHFDFDYRSENDFFEYLLRYYAKDYEYTVKREKNKISLSINSQKGNLDEFCNNFNLMPNSLFLSSFDVKAIDEEFKASEDIKKDFEKKDFLSQINAKAYREDGILLENEWGAFVDDTISFDKENFIQINKENFNECLNKAIDLLKNSKDIFIKNHLGIYSINIFDYKNLKTFLMPTETKALKLAFVCSNENFRLLASFEKPLVNLRFSKPFKEKYELKNQTFKVKFPNNIFLFALGLNLFKDDIKFLSFEKIENYEDDFEVFEQDKRLIVKRGFDFIDKKAKDIIFSKDDKNMARISYILSLFDEKSFFLELSKDYDDILLVNKENNILNLKLPRSFEEIFNEISKDSIGARLLKNFSSAFRLNSGKFESKNNFFSLFGIVAMILGFGDDIKQAANKMLNEVDESRLERGVKIDYRLKENLQEFDYTRTVRSVMSFMLAGVPSKDIAYGLVESLAYFLRDTYDDLREKKQVEIAIISGSLFESTTLLKNSLKHIKNCKTSDVALRI